MARTFEENMNDKRLTVKSLRVLQDVEGSAFEQISAEIEKTNQSIASLQGVQDRYWASIADDNIISIEEKRALYKEKQTLDTEYSIVIQNAEKNKDYVDYSGLITAYDNLNKYLAFIKVFESMSTNTKIDNRAEFYDAFDNYYIALNNVNQSILNKTSIGDLNVDNPDKITGLKAIARENDIYASFNALETSIKNSIQKYIYKLNKGDGVWLLFETQVNGFSYEFNRLIDGFPEAEELAKWEWCVSAVSVYGKENEESNITTVNVDNYGTWIPNPPKIDKATNKRQVSMTFSQPITSRILYGEIQYGITIRKQGETTFYTPELNKDPKENVNNYKKSSINSHFVTSYFSQTLPLSGQNNTKWKKKYHEITQGSSVEKNVSTSYLTNINSESIPSNATKEYDSSGNLIKVKFSKSSGSITMYYEYTLVDMPSPVDTTYQYKIIVKNITTNKEYSSLVANPISLVATANGVGDLVDNAITQNALAPDAVTADKIAAGTVTADKIAAENILAKGARAGMVSTEGLQVDDSGFFASEPFNYKYHDPVTGVEKIYPTRAGEFFVGNSPDVNDNRDEAEFLHFIKNDGQNYGGFWLKIKNFIIKGLSTIIHGVFVVKKKGETDADSFLVVNATDTTDTETGVPNRTVRIKGDIISNNRSFLYLYERVLSARKNFSLTKNSYTRLLLYPFQLDNEINSCEIEGVIRGYSSSISLKVKFYGCYYNSVTAVNYDYMGLRSSYYEIYPIIIKSSDTNSNYKTFGLSIYNKNSASGSDTLQIVSLKINGLPVSTSNISLLDGKPANLHENGYLKYDVTGGVIYLNSSKSDIDKYYYYGAIYMSVNSTSPATLFGGYWVRLKDRFLVGANDISGSAFAPGAMAGQSVLTNVPAHTHEISMDSAGVHWHKTYGNNSATNTSGVSYMLGGAGTTIYKNDNPGYCEANGSHSHKLYIKETGSVGVNILPPYLAVYMWKRVTEAEAATLSIT